MKYLLSFTITATFLFNSVATADIVFSAPPLEERDEGVKTYGALANRLSSVLGEKVIYQQPNNWAEYVENLRNDKYDIIFDGPHFTSWRIKKIGHKAVARLPGHLAFNIVTKKENWQLMDVNSLRSTTVCGIPSPNMTTSILLDLFRNEVSVPTVIAVNGDMRSLYQSLQKGKCKATVLRDLYYNKILTKEQKAGLKILYQTRKFPNLGISVSSKFSQEQIERISSILQQEDPSIIPITKRFAKNAKQFIPSNDSDFEGISELLEDVVWGW